MAAATDFRARCDAVNGVVQFNEDGVLMQCVEQQEDLTSPLVVYFDEFTPQQAAINSIPIMQMDTEQNRLATYFSIVYEATPPSAWHSLSLAYLVYLWRALELYWILPPSIMPNTPMTVRRPEGEASFYRIPNMAVIQQRPLYTLDDAAPNNAQVEIVHFGDLNRSLPVKLIETFTGTYFYKATGSGTSISMGDKTLVAWNKVHALTILGATPLQIYENAGYLFTSIVDNYTIVLSSEMDSSSAFQSALDAVVGLMVDGKSVLELGDGSITYFGLGENGDSFLALQAITQGYTSIQLMREAQWVPRESNALNPIGYEIIVLDRPAEASSQLMVTLPYPYITYAA